MSSAMPSYNSCFLVLLREVTLLLLLAAAARQVTLEGRTAWRGMLKMWYVLHRALKHCCCIGTELW